MGFWSKLKEIFGFAEKKDKIKLTVTCDNCDEEFDSVFRKSYDFQPTYGEKEFAYSINKELVCPGCYKSLYLDLKLDKKLEVLEQNLDNGELEIVDERQD